MAASSSNGRTACGLRVRFAKLVGIAGPGPSTDEIMRLLRRKSVLDRHCERSDLSAEALAKRKQSSRPPQEEWIASSQELAMTVVHPDTDRDLAAHAPRFTSHFSRPPKNERGAGNAGCAPAPEVPCAMCRRVRARAYRAAEAIDIPCAMALRLLRAPPENGSFAPSLRGTSTQLDGQHRDRQDHTTSPYASRRSLSALPASTRPVPRSWRS